jgi:hypothetical protein
MLDEFIKSLNRVSGQRGGVFLAYEYELCIISALCDRGEPLRRHAKNHGEGLRFGDGGGLQRHGRLREHAAVNA